MLPGTDQKRHIVFFTPGFAQDENDVNCIPVLQSFTRKHREIYPDTNISVLAFHYPFFRKKYSWYGLNVYAAGGKNKKYMSRIFTWIRVYRQFLQISKQQKVTDIHAFWLHECTLVGLMISRFHRVNFIASAIGQDVKKENRFLKILRYFSFPIVFESAFTARLYTRNTGKKATHIIPMGLVSADLPPGNTERTIDITGAGNLGPVKNFGLFIDIIKELHKDFPGIKTVIAGDGEQRDMLVARIKEYRLENTVILAGHLPRPELLRTMARAKILLHTSQYEGQGMVLTEALSLGLHVVAFEVGHLPVSQKSHPCKNREEMLEKLRKILRTENDFTPVTVPLMEDTLHTYQSFYSRE